MEKEFINNIAKAIASRQCVLFAGAGITGISWDELVEKLKKHFCYDSPVEDKFLLIDDMARKVTKGKVYDFVSKELKDIKMPEQFSKLTSYPWFTAFTTNYDTALEHDLNKNQNLTVRIVHTGQEFDLAGLNSQLLCVKLMGSMDVPMGQPGDMVLGASDLDCARVTRSRIFDRLAYHAANLSFLFVGYSFKDKLFMDLLNKLHATLGKLDKKHYAVFQRKPEGTGEVEIAYLLKELGVEVVEANLDDFIKIIDEQVRARNPQDYSHKQIPFYDDFVPLDVARVGGFLSQYNPVLAENYKVVPVNRYEFLKGNISALKPFNLGWHFQRKEMGELLKVILRNKNPEGIYCICGSPGFGRTFTMLAVINELVIKQGAIAIKIPNYSNPTLPQSEELMEFVNEVNRASEKLFRRKIERVVFWAEFPIDDSIMTQFRRLFRSVDSKELKLSLIYEDIKDRTWDSKVSPSQIDVSSRIIDDDEQERLVKYIQGIIKELKLESIDSDGIRAIIKQEEYFLAIIYKTLDPSRRSIKEIIHQSFSEITIPEERNAVLLCALSSYFNIDMPLVIIKKALNVLLAKELSFSNIYDVIDLKANIFLRRYEDARTNVFVVVYHTIIAKLLIETESRGKIDDLVSAIALAVDIQSPLDGDFVRKLLIENGVNRCREGALPFSVAAINKSLETIKAKQPARPVIHHLARLKNFCQESLEQVYGLLDKALQEPLDEYALTEKRSNVLTTYANIKWFREKEKYLKFSRDSEEFRKLMDLLEQAQREDFESTYAHHVQARILKEMAQNCEDENKKYFLLQEAITILSRGLDRNVGDPESYDKLNRLLIEVTEEISPEDAKAKAKQIFSEYNDGVGYFVLASQAYCREGDLDLVISYLKKCREANKYPADAILLEIKIHINQDNVDYKYLNILIDELYVRPDFVKSWKSDYYRGVLKVVSGDAGSARKCFLDSRRSASKYNKYRVELFWKEKGFRKPFSGKISNSITKREGRIYAHNIEGWKDDIYFNPAAQKTDILKSGLIVKYELGFSPIGPIAFDLRPDKK